MKIVDAFWEKRNLGVTCYELQMELADDIQEVAEKIDNLTERQYMVAKIPSSRYDLVRLFQDRGYSFSETAIELEYNYKKLGYSPPDIPRGLQKICDRCSWSEMDEADLIQLSDEIKKNMFHTDRIFIDPEFTREQAAQRYDLWAKDIIRQGHIPYKVRIDDKVIGFFLDQKISPKVYHGILGGIYTEYEDTGMGYVFEYAEFMSKLEWGAEKFVASVSGNNPKVLKLYMPFGAEIKRLIYVFIKHVEK